MLTHTDDAFATMLLCSQMSVSREEPVKPLTTAEWNALKEAVAATRLSQLGVLMELDISGLKYELDISEDRAYRLYALLSRKVPLSYALEHFLEAGIDIVTQGESGYPASILEKLGEKAPPMLYFAGSLSLAESAGVTITGLRSAREDARACAAGLAREAVRAGCAVVSGGGSRGVDQACERAALEAGGHVVCCLAESLTGKLGQLEAGRAAREGRALYLSAVHPDAPYTQSHALERNKLLYAQGLAAFAVALDSHGEAWEGAAEALRKRWCDKLYAWDTGLYPGNRALILKGATPFAGAEAVNMTQLLPHWRRPAFEQMSLF